MVRGVVTGLKTYVDKDDNSSLPSIDSQNNGRANTKGGKIQWWFVHWSIWITNCCKIISESIMAEQSQVTCNSHYEPLRLCLACRMFRAGGKSTYVIDVTVINELYLSTINRSYGESQATWLYHKFLGFFRVHGSQLYQIYMNTIWIPVMKYTTTTINAWYPDCIGYRLVWSSLINTGVVKQIVWLSWRMVRTEMHISLLEPCRHAIVCSRILSYVMRRIIVSSMCEYRCDTKTCWENVD